MRRTIRALVASTSLVLATAAPALAHPHIRIEARAVLSYAPKGDLASLRHTWTFDPAYSAFLAMGIPRDADGNAGESAMASLAATTVASLAASDHFTWLKADGHRPRLGAPTDATMRLSGGQVTISFTLPLHEPAPAAALTLEVMDPTYFVAFSFAPSEDAVTLRDAPDACKVTVVRPKGFDVATAERLAAGSLEALTSPVATDAVTNRVKVACP